MKVIDSSVDLLEQGPGLEGLFAHMETVGRISHRSESKPGESSEEFLEKIRKLGHWAVFDLGTVYLKVPERIDVKNIYKLLANKWTKWGFRDGCYYFTTNYRVILKNRLVEFMKEWWCDPVPGLHPLRATSHWICSRNIANEIVRHGAFRYIQESTRYIDYSREKHGGELVFIAPGFVQKFRPENINPGLSNSELWEFRTLYNGLQYRLLAFWDEQEKRLVVATHGFVKKTWKVPAKEIKKAEQLRKKYYESK